MDIFDFEEVIELLLFISVTDFLFVEGVLVVSFLRSLLELSFDIFGCDVYYSFMSLDSGNLLGIDSYLLFLEEVLALEFCTDDNFTDESYFIEFYLWEFKFWEFYFSPNFFEDCFDL